MFTILSLTIFPETYYQKNSLLHFLNHFLPQQCYTSVGHYTTHISSYHSIIVPQLKCLASVARKATPCETCLTQTTRNVFVLEMKRWWRNIFYIWYFVLCKPVNPSSVCADCSKYSIVLSDCSSSRVTKFYIWRYSFATKWQELPFKIRFPKLVQGSQSCLPYGKAQQLKNWRFLEVNWVKTCFFVFSFCWKGFVEKIETSAMRKTSFSLTSMKNCESG